MTRFLDARQLAWGLKAARCEAAVFAGYQTTFSLKKNAKASAAIRSSSVDKELFVLLPKM